MKKRIALSVVTALAGGLLVAAPASAALATTVAVVTTADATLYTTSGTSVATNISLATTTNETQAGALTVTPTIVSSPAGSTLTIGAAGTDKAGLTLTNLSTTSFATSDAANKWTSTTSAGVNSYAYSSGTITAHTASVAGQLAVAPSVPGRYVIRLTPAGAATTNTAADVVVYVSGANGTVGTAGAGTTELTAASGGQAAFTYTTPNSTTAGSIYVFQSSGVGTIIGATGLKTDNSTANNPVPYNGTTGDFSAGAKFTTGAETTSETATLTLQSSVAGTQTVTITKIDATTGSPVAITSVTVTWNAGTSLNLTTLRVSTLPGDDAANCTVANKATTTHNSINRMASNDQTNSAATDVDLCVIALDGNGAQKALYSLTVLATGVGFIGQDAASTTYGVSSTSTDKDGVAQFNLAGSLISGVGTYAVTAKALNADGTTYTTLTGSATVNFFNAGSSGNTPATIVLTNAKYVLDDSDAATVVAHYSVKDKNGFAVAYGASSNLLADSDIATTLVIDEHGETDAAAGVSVSAQNTVSALGVETKGDISVDCAATNYEKIVISMHNASDTVKSNSITVYCSDSAAVSLVASAVDAAASSTQEVTATAIADIDGKSYPVADGATVTFAVNAGSLSAASATTENGVATVTYNAPLSAAAVTLTTAIVADDLTATKAFAISKSAAETSADAAAAAAAKAGVDAVAAAKAAGEAAVAAANAAAAAAAKAGTDAVAAAATAKAAADAAAAAAVQAGKDAAAASAAAGLKADAATAAAKAASDAVAALSTSVAGLQTTVASLVASMTAQIKVINASMLKIAKKLGVKI